MFLFALKNMAVKRAQMILLTLSVVISAGVAVLAYNTAEQVSDGIAGTAGYYSAIVGPAGSATQLAMNTMYFTDTPLGTIPYSVAGELQQDSRVREVIPFAMADSYNGANLVGTSPAYLASKQIAEGEMFSESGEFEVVLGAEVARANRLAVGDQIYTSHAVGEEHKTPFTVVGILEKTYTAYDNVVFTQVKSIWEVHEHEEGEEEEHEEHEHMDGMLCAVLVKTRTPGDAMNLVNQYNGKVVSDEDGDTFALQAVEPMATVRGVLEEANTTKYIVFILCAIILVMNLMIISIVTLLNTLNAKPEISLMRLIGVSMKKINLLYIIQNGLVGLCSVLLAFGVSRLCLSLMGGFVASMGVVLNVGKVYPLEFLVLGCVFLISVLPTVVCTAVMSKKDSL